MSSWCIHCAGALPRHVITSYSIHYTKLYEVLRNFQRRRSELEAAVAGSEQSQYAHPAWLIKILQADWPKDWKAVLQANNERPPFSLRVNRLRMTREDYLQLLVGQELMAMPLTHTSHGIVLERAVPVEDLPGFSDGLVSVQDGAAQLVAGLRNNFV